MIVVRPVRPQEYARAGEVVVAAYEAEDYLRRPDGSYDHRYAALLRDVTARAEKSEVLVAELDGAIAGSVTWCGPGSPLRELATRDDQGEFRMLGVEPQAARRGVASAMVRWCLDRAAADGLAEIVLSSLRVMEPAHRVYLRHGFVRRRDLDWRPLPEVDLVGFSRAL